MFSLEDCDEEIVAYYKTVSASEYAVFMKAWFNKYFGEF